MAYSVKVLDHYENPRNVGSFQRGLWRAAEGNEAVTWKRGRLSALLITPSRATLAGRWEEGCRS